MQICVRYSCSLSTYRPVTLGTHDMPAARVSRCTAEPRAAGPGNIASVLPRPRDDNTLLAGSHRQRLASLPPPSSNRGSAHSPLSKYTTLGFSTRHRGEERESRDKKDGRHVVWFSHHPQTSSYQVSLVSSLSSHAYRAECRECLAISH